MTGTRLHLVDERGGVDTDGAAWLGPASVEDRVILSRAVGPVLDVGCGPGRHVRALQALGVEVLGIDVTPAVLESAAVRGAPVLAASVFASFPRIGQWQTALLLDGNSGLGGDPVRLLRRLLCVLRPDGRILADLDDGPKVTPRRVRLRHGRQLGPQFRWAPLHVDHLDLVADSAGYEVLDAWHCERRWFCELGRADAGRRHDSSARPVTRPSRLSPANRRPKALEALIRHYGAGPLHLLALLASFAFAGYVVARVATVAHRWQILLWFVGALILNDFILFPLYSMADRSWRSKSRRHPETLPRVPWINHLRAPAVVSGVLLLISFPMVFRLDPTDYQRATNLTPNPYLARWLLITAVLFATSALLYALRLARTIRTGPVALPSAGDPPPSNQG